MSIFSQEALVTWLDTILQTQTLIAPRDVSGVLLYRPVSDIREIVWDYTRPVMSLKDALFPATERLLTIQKTGQTIEMRENIPENEQVIFGVRSCDARGLLVLDALFIDTEPVDPYYAQRRSQTTLIGLACTEMADTCFCTSTGGAPDDPSGMDVMIYPTEGGYWIQVLTEKGVHITQMLADRDQLSEARSAATFGANPVYTVPEKTSWPARFDDNFWAEMAERCLSCRICAYVCPTCRCFDLRDEPLLHGNQPEAFERIRCWDSCAGTIYRRIAGGHNPRAAKGDRLRNRFMCKFYYYAEQYGPAACTGCGRCIESCPVNIDITEILAHVGAQS